MDLKRPLPPNRTYEQIKNHYVVEKAIAEKLKQANREERKLIYATMYDDLFKQVPDHSRLTRRASEKLTFAANKSKFALLKKFIDKDTIFVEFAPGDCKFACEVAKCVTFVYGVDISDQGNKNENFPTNFKLIIYDGYTLKEIKENSIDIAFSDQLIEHLHPEDTKLHFYLIYSILKKGGKYIFRTPHLFTGPHDISKYFSDIPEGFHLKEWTYLELRKMIKEIGESQFYGFRYLKGRRIKLPFLYIFICEKFIKLFSGQYRRFIARYLLPEVCVIMIK